jgi:hypothetical protein
MRFSSSVEVVINEKNELFNTISLYVPKAYALGNIVGWEDLAAEVTATKPVVLTVDVTNYAKIMKGSMLDQWIDAFNQDTNIDMLVYIIVFDDSQTGSWVIGAKSIDYAPLTSAFTKLYSISYVKMLFDEHYDGLDVVIPYPGTHASRTISITNGTLASHTLLAGTYVYNDTVKSYTLEVLANMVMAPSDTATGIVLYADTVGVDADLATGVMTIGDFSPALGGGAELLTFTTTAIVQGIAANPTPAAVPSKYFDLSLALAYQCVLNVKNSFHWSLVKVALSQTGYPVASSVDTNPCRITSFDSAAQKLGMTALNMDATVLIPKPRTQCYWGALWLMTAVNTWATVHSEGTNVITEVLSAWFKARNASGQYIGNKLSLLRLSGPKIKPLGYPSWLNSEVNENFTAAFDRLDAMNVGYLMTIADNTPQDCALSSARGITGLPVNAMMISKFVDYESAQDCAKLITDKGTLTDPVLTDEHAYTKIQNIVKDNLMLFVATNRLTQISLQFPPFAVAKTGMTKLEAASAWSAKYVDDLDSVTVTGGITAS